MKELDSKEIVQVGGGVHQYIVGWGVGRIIDHGLRSYVKYWERSVENGWGRSGVEVPRNSEGFGTI